jgi:hypothetical protein
MLPCRGGVMARCYNGTCSACSACRSLFLSLSGSLSPNQGGGGVVRGERWEAAGSASGTRVHEKRIEKLGGPGVGRRRRRDGMGSCRASRRSATTSMSRHEQA